MFSKFFIYRGMEAIKVACSVTLLLLLGAGCGDGAVDLDPPTMDVVNYVPAPVEDEVCGSQEPVVFLLTGGDELNFDVVFKDNEALSQYKIDIHNNFDCHGHGGGSAPAVVAPNVENQTTDWSVLEIQNISGITSPIDRVLNVPQNVTAGFYHFQIQVLDESGNDNSASNVFSLNIKNPIDDIPPEISIDEPAISSFSAAKGSSITFSGQITDERSLSDGGNGILYLAYTDLSSGNTFATDQAFSFDENVGTNYDFNFEYTIPQTLVPRDYRFSLGANDGVRNVAEFAFFHVEVTD